MELYIHVRLASRLTSELRYNSFKLLITQFEYNVWKCTRINIYNDMQMEFTITDGYIEYTMDNSDYTSGIAKWKVANTKSRNYFP